MLVLLSACGQPAQSQEQVAPQRVEMDAATAAADVMQSRQTAITRAVAVASPAVVSINVIEVQRVRYRDPFASPFFEQFYGRRRSRVYERQVQGLGSGFILSPDGYIVTNDHVAGNATKITVALHDGTTLDGRLVGTDPATDLALVKVDSPEPLPYLAFSQEDPLVGEWAIALGNPFGLFEATEPTVTVGVVSAVDRDFQPQEGRVYRDMIQTDASINQGNSGGPLINALGEVIGVNSFIYTQRGGGSIGLGFAVPSNKAQRIIDELRENGAVDRSYYLGLYGRDLTPRIARALNLNRSGGIFVEDIDDGSPAAEAGFRPYDVIVSFEGEDLGSQSEFAARLYDYRPGDQIRLGLIRDGEPVEVLMRIGRQAGDS